MSSLSSDEVKFSPALSVRVDDRDLTGLRCESWAFKNARDTGLPPNEIVTGFGQSVWFLSRTRTLSRTSLVLVLKYRDAVCSYGTVP
jgi:hypothetical protein